MLEDLASNAKNDSGGGDGGGGDGGGGESGGGKSGGGGSNDMIVSETVKTALETAL